MTLQLSGAISLDDVNIELGNASGTQLSLGGSSVRDLAGVPSGAIALSDLYGASSAAVYTGAQTFNRVFNSSDGGVYWWKAATSSFQTTYIGNVVGWNIPAGSSGTLGGFILPSGVQVVGFIIYHQTAGDPYMSLFTGADTTLTGFTIDVTSPAVFSAGTASGPVTKRNRPPGSNQYEHQISAFADFQAQLTSGPVTFDITVYEA